MVLPLALGSAAALVVLGWWVGGPGLALGIAAVLAAAGGVVLTQRRTSAREVAATRSLERAVRASETTRNRAAEPEVVASVEDLLSSRILDVAHYEALARRRFSDSEEAARDFLERGMQSLLAPNSLLDPEFLPESVRRRYAAGDLGALLAFLRRAPATMPPLSPAFSPSMVEASEAMLRAHPGGSLGWFIEHADDRDLLPTARFHVRWAAFSAAMEAARRADRDASTGERNERLPLAIPSFPVAGRCSVVLIDAGEAAETVAAARAAIASARGDDVEVIVVIRGASLNRRLALAGALSGEARVRFTDASDLLAAAAGATGAMVCLMLEPVLLRRGWNRALREVLASPGVVAVQPLVLRVDESIDGAGLSWPQGGTMAARLLDGRPPEDAELADGVDLLALCGPVVAVAAGRLAAVARGVEEADPDAAALELSLRLRALGEGALRCVVDAVAVRVGDRTDDSSPPGTRLVPVIERWRARMPEPLPVEAPAAERSAPRWGIRFASVGGEAGDRWGDTAFAASLADALRAQGQEVVTYRHGANARIEAMADDVSVVIRGKDRLEPVPGAVNVLWIISHPDTVSDEELGAFDLVYAASSSWARQRSEASGTPIGVLLQCTDASKFGPDGAVGPARPATFVGSVHPGRRRAVVADALAAGVDLRVIGSGWQRTLPPDVLEGAHVSNDRLAEVYRSARVVLADHWRTMADAGFIQNRIFDALACAAPVVSDRVEGMEAALNGAVAEYGSLEELAMLCDGTASHPAGDRTARERIAQRILAEHSFDARARTLLHDVELRMRGD